MIRKAFDYYAPLVSTVLVGDILAGERLFTYTKNSYYGVIIYKIYVKKSIHQFIGTPDQYLNERIDAKIISGQQYMAEAQKHRMLLQKIRTQKREQKKGFIGRVFPLFA